VGKLLGATLMVNGAYQKALPQVRLTARLVNVETGEIVGTAKVDGAATDLLRLQDKITAELLRSAGLGAHARRIVEQSSHKPSLKSLKTMELYGDAVVAQNDEQRSELLKLAIAEDAAFTYAAKDLAELEQRMKGYEAQAKAAQERELTQTRQKLGSESDPAKQSQLAMQLLNLLQASRRARALRAEAQKLAARSWPSPLGTLRIEEIAAFYMVVADMTLRDRDALLRDGEQFMQRFPTSMYFTAVKAYMEQAIRDKREIEDGKQKAAEQAARLRSQDRWDLCAVAHPYRRHKQYAEAVRLYSACLAVGTSDRKQALADLIGAEIEMGDWAQARKHAAELAKQFPDYYKTMKQSYDAQIPVDG
jgi:hypothetical protein